MLAITWNNRFKIIQRKPESTSDRPSKSRDESKSPKCPQGELKGEDIRVETLLQRDCVTRWRTHGISDQIPPAPQNVSQPAKEPESPPLRVHRKAMFTKSKGHSYRPDSHHQQATKTSRHRTLHIPVGSQTATPNKEQGRVDSC